MNTINIKGANKAELLAALYNRSKVLGAGFLAALTAPAHMSANEAQAIIDGGQLTFDYLGGRVMKVDLSGDELRPHLYDRDNGPGAAYSAISHLVSEQDSYDSQTSSA